MPTYEVTHPDGRVIELVGDSPPTEAELEEIFASLAPAPEEQAPAAPKPTPPEAIGVAPFLSPGTTKRVQALAREGVPQPPLQRGEEKMEPAPGVRGIPPTAVVIPQEEAAEPAQWRKGREQPEVPGARGFALAAEQQEKARYKRAYERITGLAEGVAVVGGELALGGALGALPPSAKLDLKVVDDLRQANAKAAAEGDVKGAAMREIEGIASLVMKAPELIAGYEAESERELDFDEIAQKANEEAA